MKYYLVTCSKDWADEFETYSYAVHTEEEIKDFEKILYAEENADKLFNYGFGTNEGWEGDETVADVWNNDFEKREIDETQFKVLKEFSFRGNAPDMSDLKEIMNSDGEEDYW